MPGAHELPNALLAHAVEAAEGVPLFLEQFMISLIEEHRRSPDLNSEACWRSALVRREDVRTS